MNQNKTETSFLNSPEQIVALTNKASEARAKKPLAIVLLGAVMAGIFIAIGASSSSAAVYGISNTGLAKTLCGAIFPIGLMLVIMLGGELFTGSTMMMMATLKKRLSLQKNFALLGIIFIGNLLGGLIIVFFVANSGQFNIDGGSIGAYTIKVAAGKVAIPWFTAFCSGVMCNTIVCLGILLAAAAKSVTGKILASFFSIWAFVIGGYEHCVANMYYIPAGMVAASNPAYAAKAAELYNISPDALASLNIGSMIVNNLIPVTLGNMFGGIVIVSLAMVILHARKKREI